MKIKEIVRLLFLRKLINLEAVLIIDKELSIEVQKLRDVLLSGSFITPEN